MGLFAFAETETGNQDSHEGRMKNVFGDSSVPTFLGHFVPQPQMALPGLHRGHLEASQPHGTTSLWVPATDLLCLYGQRESRERHTSGSRGHSPLVSKRRPLHADLQWDSASLPAAQQTILSFSSEVCCLLLLLSFPPSPFPSAAPHSCSFRPFGSQ